MRAPSVRRRREWYLRARRLHRTGDMHSRRLSAGVTQQNRIYIYEPDKINHGDAMAAKTDVDARKHSASRKSWYAKWLLPWVNSNVRSRDTRRRLPLRIWGGQVLIIFSDPYLDLGMGIKTGERRSNVWGGNRGQWTSIVLLILATALEKLSDCVMVLICFFSCTYRVAQKVSHYHMIKKSY